jgi:Ulp1 family protease
VNQVGHWSLCCVVNPGVILNNTRKSNGLKVVPSDDQPYACILFFDSLKNFHPKSMIAKKVRGWLNSEWTRLEKASNDHDQNPFKADTLKFYQPTGEFSGVLLSFL